MSLQSCRTDFPLGIGLWLADKRKLEFVEMNLKKRLISGFGLLLSIVFLTGCVTEPSALTGEKKSYGYTWQQELEIGKSSDHDLVREMGLYPDESLSNYVTEIGERVLTQSNLRQPDTPEIYRDLKFTFRVMDSPVVNAFALPGGYVYVTRGLLAHLNNEAQLAVVLGHEITHVAARHASQQALKEQWGQIGLVAGAVIGQGITGNERFADQFLGLGGSVFQILNLKYGRDAERESDIYGVEYSAKAGYEVGESAAFFDSLGRISEQSGQSLPTWQSSHPDSGERQNLINQLALEMRQKYGDLKVGETEYLRRIDGLVVGENPRQGFVLRGKFYHPALDFQFSIPEGWRVKNEAGRVTLVDRLGKGVIILSGEEGDTPEVAARSFVASSKVQPIRLEPSRLGGSPGYVVGGVVFTSNGPVFMRNRFFSHRRSVFSFLSYASVEEIDIYRPAFDEVTGSFGRVQDRAIRNLQPARLYVVSADRETEFDSYLSTELPWGFENIELAIMNQVNLKDKIRKGQKLKLVSQ